MREREKNWLRTSVRMEWTWSQLQRAAAARRPLCEKFALDLDGNDDDVVFDEGSSLVRVYGPPAEHSDGTSALLLPMGRPASTY